MSGEKEMAPPAGFEPATVGLESGLQSIEFIRVIADCFYWSGIIPP